MSKTLSTKDYVGLATLATISASGVYIWANLAVEGPLGLQIFFTIGGALAAILFQIAILEGVVQEPRPSCCTLLSLCAQTVLSSIANLALFFLALDGIDDFVPGPWALTIALKGLAALGWIEESYFGVLGTGELFKEIPFIFHWLLGFCSERHKLKAIDLRRPELEDDLKHFNVRCSSVTERFLPYYEKYPRYRSISISLGILLGTSSAACYFYNVVPFVLEHLLKNIPQLKAVELPLKILLWLLNIYNAGFCITYGNQGGRALLTRALPTFFYGTNGDCLAVVLALLLVGISMGPAIEISRGANIFGAVNIGLCYGPGALSMGKRIINKIFPESSTPMRDLSSTDTPKELLLQEIVSEDLTQ